MKAGQRESFIGEITREWERERPDLDLRDFLLAIYLRRLGRLIENEYNRMCQARFGMSAWDMRVLLALRRGGPPYAMRPTDLFEALLVTSGAVTKHRSPGAAAAGQALRGPDYGAGFHQRERGLEISSHLRLPATSNIDFTATTRSMGEGNPFL